MNQKEMIRNALVAAKQYLAEDEEELHSKEEFICIAITDAATYRKCTEIEADLAEQLIMSRIGENYTAEGWLERKIGKKTVLVAGRTAVQQWRHRWLDSLIGEFSK